MATATRIEQDFPVTTIETRQTGVTLHLSNNEAAAIKAVLGRVRGSESRSARGYTSRVYAVLSESGFDTCDLESTTGKLAHKFRELIRTNGGIYFRDFEDGTLEE